MTRDGDVATAPALLSNNRTTIGRGLGGIAAGAATGLAILVPVAVWLVLGWNEDQPSWPWGVVYFATIFAGLGMLPLGGSFLIGTPVWGWLRGREQDSWPMAALVGYVTTAASACLVLSLDGGFDIVMLRLSAIFGVVGAISWAVGWRVAYRRR